MKYLIISIVIILNVVSVLYIYRLHPDDSMSLGLIYIIPVVFIINLLLGVIFRFVSSYHYYLYINSVINSVIVCASFFILVDYFKIHNIKNKFLIVDGTTYYMHFYNRNNTFEIGNSMTNDVIEGEYSIYNGVIKLNMIDENEKVYIKENIIYNFPRSGMSVFLKSVENE